MDDPSTLLAGAALLCLIGTALLSLVRGAQIAFSPSRLENRLTDDVQRSRLEAYLSDPARRRATVDFVATFLDVAFICLVFQGVVDRFEGVVPALLMILLGGLFFLLGRLLPRRIGNQRAESVMARVLGPLELATRTIGILSRPFTLLTDQVLRLVGTSNRKDEGPAEDPILSTVADKEREGLIRRGEKDMIAGIIELKDCDVSEVMTPRTEVVMVALTDSIPVAVGVAVECGYSRLPVFSKTRDNVVGTLYVKDFLRHWGAGESAELTIESVMRRPFFVPETKHIGELLREFQAMKVHIAIVLDEYGGTAGLVTIEDIIEEIVGEIADEYDEHESGRFQVIDPNQVDVDARVPIDEINESLSIQIPDGDDFETLGGFIVHELGRIPSVGENFSWENLRFTVLDADERRIHRVQLVVGREDNGAGSD